jgi:hypothetical protein
LLNEQEDTLYRQTFAIDSGKTYLPLNVWIEPDLDYLLTTDRLTNQMSFNVNSPRLYRSDRDFIYPFTIHDVVSLTGTASSQQFYYYFYDWHLTREDQYCTGDLLPVQVVVVDTSSSVYAPYIEPLQLIPNPADEYIRIGDVQLLQNADISLYDARGVQVEKLRVDLPSASLFIGDLAEGMYYVKVIRGEKIYLGQFVKM